MPPLLNLSPYDTRTSILHLSHDPMEGLERWASMHACFPIVKGSIIEGVHVRSNVLGEHLHFLYSEHAARVASVTQVHSRPMVDLHCRAGFTPS